jgi:hypothetical protein
LTPPSGDDLFVHRHDATDGEFTGGQGLPRLVQGNPHKLFVFASHRKNDGPVKSGKMPGLSFRTQ